MMKTPWIGPCKMIEFRDTPRVSKSHFGWDEYRRGWCDSNAMSMVPISIWGQVLPTCLRNTRFSIIGWTYRLRTGHHHAENTCQHPEFMPTMSVNVVKQSPLKRFAQHTTSSCAVQATNYGKCIMASYTDVNKDMCSAEFLLFKDCLRNAVCQIFFTCRWIPQTQVM